MQDMWLSSRYSIYYFSLLDQGMCAECFEELMQVVPTGNTAQNDVQREDLAKNRPSRRTIKRERYFSIGQIEFIRTSVDE